MTIHINRAWANHLLVSCFDEDGKPVKRFRFGEGHPLIRFRDSVVKLYCMMKLKNGG